MQKSISWAVRASSSQTALGAKSLNGRLVRPIPWRRMRSSTRARGDGGPPGTRSLSAWSVRDELENDAVVVGEGELRARVRALATEITGRPRASARSRRSVSSATRAPSRGAPSGERRLVHASRATRGSRPGPARSGRSPPRNRDPPVARSRRSANMRQAGGVRAHQDLGLPVARARELLQRVREHDVDRGVVWSRRCPAAAAPPALPPRQSR